MDVEEHRVHGLRFQGPQRFCTRGRPVDGANPFIPSQQEGQLLHGGQFVISDEHVDHP